MDIKIKTITVGRRCVAAIFLFILCVPLRLMAGTQLGLQYDQTTRGIATTGLVFTAGASFSNVLTASNISPQSITIGGQTYTSLTSGGPGGNGGTNFYPTAAMPDATFAGHFSSQNGSNTFVLDRLLGLSTSGASGTSTNAQIAVVATNAWNASSATNSGVATNTPAGIPVASSNQVAVATNNIPVVFPNVANATTNGQNNIKFDGTKILSDGAGGLIATNLTAQTNTAAVFNGGIFNGSGSGLMGVPNSALPANVVTNKSTGPIFTNDTTAGIKTADVFSNAASQVVMKGGSTPGVSEFTGSIQADGGFYGSAQGITNIGNGFASMFGAFGPFNTAFGTTLTNFVNGLANNILGAGSLLNAQNALTNIMQAGQPIGSFNVNQVSLRGSAIALVNVDYQTNAISGWFTNANGSAILYSIGTGFSSVYTNGVLTGFQLSGFNYGSAQWLDNASITALSPPQSDWGKVWNMGAISVPQDNMATASNAYALGGIPASVWNGYMSSNTVNVNLIVTNLLYSYGSDWASLNVTDWVWNPNISLAGHFSGAFTNPFNNNIEIYDAGAADVFSGNWLVVTNVLGLGSSLTDSVDNGGIPADMWVYVGSPNPTNPAADNFTQKAAGGFLGPNTAPNIFNETTPGTLTNYSPTMPLSTNAMGVELPYNAYRIRDILINNFRNSVTTRIMFLGDSYCDPNKWGGQLAYDLNLAAEGWVGGNQISPCINADGSPLSFPEFTSGSADQTPAYFNTAAVCPLASTWWGTHGGGSVTAGPFTNVNRLTFCWWTWPEGASNLILYANGSPLMTVNGFSAQTNSASTNIGVALGTYTLSMGTTSTANTNLVFGMTAYQTNSQGVATFFTANGGQFTSSMPQSAAAYSNFWAAINPDIVFYIDKHSPSGLDSALHLVNGCFQNTNALFVLVGSAEEPPGVAGANYIQTYYQIAQEYGWAYLDTHATVNEWTNFLSDDSIHPNAVGTPWGAARLEKEFGLIGQDDPSAALWNALVVNHRVAPSGINTNGATPGQFLSYNGGTATWANNGVGLTNVPFTGLSGSIGNGQLPSYLITNNVPGTPSVDTTSTNPVIISGFNLSNARNNSMTLTIVTTASGQTANTLYGKINFSSSFPSGNLPNFVMTLNAASTASGVQNQFGCSNNASSMWIFSLNAAPSSSKTYSYNLVGF